MLSEKIRQLRRPRRLSWAQWAAVFLVLFGLPAQSLADYVYDHSESSLTLNLGSPNSTSDVIQGTPAPVTMHVSRTTWEVWIDEYGTTDVRNTSSVDADGATATFTVESGDGYVDISSSTIDSYGNTSLTLFMGASTSVLRADVVDSATSSSASATLTFSPPPPTESEIYEYNHSEASLYVNASTPGSTSLGTGETASVDVYAEITTWEVWTSNFGNSDIRNTTTNPVGYGSCYLTASNGGSVQSYYVSFDGSGHATTTFTMGSQSSTVHADVNYSSWSGSADLNFSHTGSGTFVYDHSESGLGLTLASSNSTTGVAAGTPAPVTLHVSYNTWEVWVDENGATESRNNSSSDASGASVNFTVESGDSYVDIPSTTLDSYGNTSLTLFMGSANSVLRSDVTYSGLSASATLTFTAPTSEPEIYEYNHTEASLAVSMSTSGSTTLGTGATAPVDVYAEITTTEVWTSNFGNTDYRNSSTGPVGYGSCYLTASNGGSVQSYYVSFDGSGHAATTFTMGSQNSTVHADVTYSSWSGSADLNFTFDAGNEEVYSYDSTETTFNSFTLSTNSTTVVYGAPQTVVAHVSVDTRELWISNLGHSEYRNAATVGLAGQYVTFTASGAHCYVTSGDGTTDSSGNVSTTFVLNYDNSGMVTAYYNGASTSASLTFVEGEVFAFDHSESSLAVNVTAPGGTAIPANDASTAFVQALVTTWEVWTSNHGNSEVRNSVTAPAVGADFAFSLDGSVGASLGTPSGVTDASGMGSSAVSIVSEAPLVTASVTYGSLSGSGSIQFTLYTPPPEEFTFNHSESSFYVTLSTIDPTTNLNPGDTRMITINASTSTWEVWTSNYGNSEIRNSTSAGADGYVSINIDYGDGTFTGNSGQVNSGYGSFTFIMGSADTQVTVGASGMSGGSGSASILFTASHGEVFAYDHTETTLSFSMTPQGSTELNPAETCDILFHVGYESIEVWTGDMGSTDYRNASSGNAEGAYISTAVLYDGSMTAPGYTDSSGNFTGTYTMGASDATVWGYASFGPASAYASVSFNLPAVEEVYTYDHTENSLSVYLSAPYGNSGPFGSELPVQAYVTMDSVEVWVSNYGHTDYRNSSSGPAGGAALSFTIQVGTGYVNPSLVYTDGSGYATVTYTTNDTDSLVNCNASFNGASGGHTIDFYLTP